MRQGFGAGRTAAFVAQAVLDATGEVVAERTVARRAAEWRAENEARQARRERMADLVAAMKASGMDGSEMVQALAIDHLVEHPEALTGADPIDLQGLSLEAEKLQLKKREVDIRERAVAMDERKLALLEQRDARVKAVAEKPALSDAERVAEIQEIYGIRSKAS